MKKLLVYLKDYKRESILGPIFKLLEASFELLVPLVMAAIIDKGIGHEDQRYVIEMCLILVALGVIGLTCSVTAQYFAAKAAVGFSTKLRHALFEHIQSFSFSEIDEAGTPTLITRMTSDVNQVQSGVNMVLRLFLRSPFIVFGAMVMAFTIDVKVALVFLVTIPLLSLVVFGIMSVTIPLYRKVQLGLDRVLLLTRENLTGTRVIRAFNKEKDAVLQFEESNSSLTSIQLFVGKISALTNPVTYVIINAASIALIWTGALRVDSGMITQGQLIALINYMSQILVELIKLANLIVTITKALACANRIQSVFEMKPGIIGDVNGRKEGTAKNTILEFQNVCLTYKGAGDESLSDISFKVERGETVGIIGGTGSGKSSLVNLIPRFYDATKGKILFYGEDVEQYDVDTLRRKIGMVMQKAVLFRGTIRENLLWGKENASLEELSEALSVSQSKEFVMQKKEGMETVVEQGGRNLSGGQKQRLTIARALVRKPEILILDDSASALDFQTDAKLRRAIREVSQKLTVFIVSQRASSIQYADKILVLDDGRIVGQGTHKELLEDCPVYQEIYYSQFPKEEV